MTMDAATEFADLAAADPNIQAQLDAVSSTDAGERVDALVGVGAQAGYDFTSEDYYNSGSIRAAEVNEAWPVETAQQAAPVASPLQPYAQYGSPYSAFPPIPPPMPTYLPPPPYIPHKEPGEGA